jgi:hypothetical protein
VLASSANPFATTPIYSHKSCCFHHPTKLYNSRKRKIGIEQVGHGVSSGTGAHVSPKEGVEMNVIEVKAFLCDECGEEIELGPRGASEGPVLRTWVFHALDHLMILPAYACGACRSVYPHQSSAEACCK